MKTLTLKTSLRSFLVCLVSLVLVQCNFSASKIDDDGLTGSVSGGYLTSYSSCDEFLTDVQQNLITKMEENLDSYFECNDYDDEDAVSITSSDSGDSSSVTYTDTNLQEQNVDEADIIKTDGETIYVATSAGIDVFKAWPLSEFGKISSYTLEQGADELYLQDDTLIAVTNYYNSEEEKSFNRVTVLDASNPAVLALKDEREMQGSYASSRFVDGVLHLVSSSSLSSSYDYPDYDYELYSAKCDGDESAAAEFEQMLEQTIETNRATILATTIEDYLPLHNDGTGFTAVDCTDIAKDGAEDTSLVGLWSWDILNEQGDEEITFIKGRAHEIYASTQSMYFAANVSDLDATYIHKFLIGEGGVHLHTYFGSGGVEGHISNSFSMSEEDGYFRIATTVGNVSWEEDLDDVWNNVYILDAGDTALPVVGSVENFAAGEKIYAARFLGDKGYIVTFDKVDPLFVIDVSDPENPEIQGELEMPGYSTYLHPLDDDHIIGLGKAAEEAEEGDFAWFQGLKLAVFDVSDATNPSLFDEEIIGSRGTGSQALSDHHAFTFDSESGLLALPISYYTGGTGGSDSGEFEYYGVHLLSLTADGGVSVVAEIPIDDASSPKRTLMLGDDTAMGLFVLDSSQLFLIEMSGDYDILGSEDLSDADSCEDCYYY